MAVLGAQLVFSMVVACLLERMSRYVSFGRWLITFRLVRYLYPTDAELKAMLTCTSSGKGKQKREREFRRFNGASSQARNVKDIFTVPKSLPLQLESAEVCGVDVMPLRFYPELSWVLDFSLASSLIFLTTEGYYTFTSISGARPGEVNISMLWLTLALWFTFKLLCSLSSLYFRGEDTGERSVCLTSAFASLLFGMIILIVDESVLEFGLDQAYSSFNASAVEFLRLQGIDSQGPASKLSLKLILVSVSALLGALLVFPGIRMAKMHVDALLYCSESKFYRFLLYVNYLMPLFVVLSWIRPVGRHLIRQSFPHLFMTDEMFNSGRLWVLVFLVVVRFSLTSFHLQAYLNTASAELEALKKENGRISNIELQKKVARIFQYLCVVALQYLLPVLMLLFLTCCLKYLGCHSWFGTEVADCANLMQTQAKNVSFPDSATSDDTIAEAAQQFALSLQSLRTVFSATVFRGVFNYLCWWICTVYFLSQLFGLVFVTNYPSSL